MADFFIENFKIIEKNDFTKKLIAECQLCVNKQKISGSVSSTGNFLKHLKRKHSHALKEYQQNKKRKRENEGEEEKLTPFERCTKQVKQDITSFVCHFLEDQMLPLATVESDSFKNLLKNLRSDIQIPCRATVKSRMISRKEVMVSNIKNTLENQNYVCTTADIWSSNNKSYLGVTCHYIDCNYKRKSLVLACKRLKFKHTYLEIAKSLFSIHNSFNLSHNKIVGTVTDNATNFGKSFKIFSFSEESSLEYDFLNDENNLIDILDVSALNDINVDLLDDEIILPIHFKCFSHTLNLIATKDVEAALQNPVYKKIYNSTFSKLSALWNICSRSASAADHVEKICNSKLVIPCATRWNSLFDSIQKILSLKDYLPSVCQAVNKPMLKTTEIEFLEEYSIVMNVIARATDVLQGENNCFLGYVLPTIYQILHKLSQISSMVYCNSLKDAIKNGINRRFSDILNFDHKSSIPYILASVTIPKFKLFWVNNKLHEDKMKNLLLEELKQVKQNTNNSLNTYNKINDSAENDEFFDFHINCESNLITDSTENTVTLELAQYLADNSKQLNVLENYNKIKEVFFKYNTILPSSAPVERLFSTGGHILTPKRNRLSNDIFETLLLLKKNVNFIE